MLSSAPSRPFADHSLPLVLLMVTLVFWAGFMALVIRDAMLSDTTSGTVVAVFPPDRATHENYASILHAEGLIFQSAWFDTIWVVRSERAGFVGRLKQQGAWAAFPADTFQPIILGGCFLAPGTFASRDDVSETALKTTTRSR